jgi:hypothetical protein
MLININIAVWDSYTGEIDNTGIFVVDHKRDLVQLAQTSGVDPLVLGREIHQLFCGLDGVEDPNDYIHQGHVPIWGANGTDLEALISVWLHKESGMISTYNCKIWEK